MYNGKTILTNMCMIQNEKGEVLIQNRNNKDWPGLAFPGGHVEYGESIVESTIREIKEETGLDIYNLKLCGIKDWCISREARYIVFLFKTNEFKGEVLEKSPEGKNYWITIKELKKSNTAMTFIETLPLFLGNDKNEIFFNEMGELLTF